MTPVTVPVIVSASKCPGFLWDVCVTQLEEIVRNRDEGSERIRIVDKWLC